MPRDHRGSQSASGISRSRLNPNALEDAFAQDSSIRHTIKRHAPGEAEVLQAGLRPHMPGDAEHDLFRDLLHRPRQIHISLRQARLRLARRAAKQLVECGAGHRQTNAVIEVPHVQPKGAVLLEVEQFPEDDINVFRLSVGSQPHQLVLAGIDLETGEIRERRVEQPKRMREMKLTLELHAIASAHSKTGGSPFAHSVHRQDRRLGIR